jgi:hypothetical protein
MKSVLVLVSLMTYLTALPKSTYLTALPKSTYLTALLKSTYLTALLKSTYLTALPKSTYLQTPTIVYPSNPSFLCHKSHCIRQIMMLWYQHFYDTNFLATSHRPTYNGWIQWHETIWTLQIEMEWKELTWFPIPPQGQLWTSKPVPLLVFIFHL